MSDEKLKKESGKESESKGGPAMFDDVRKLSRERQKQIAYRATEIAASGEAMLGRLADASPEDRLAVIGSQDLLNITRAEAVDTLEQIANPKLFGEGAVAAESVEKTPISPTLDRLNRHLGAAESVRKFESGAEISATERERLAGMLEGGAWQKILQKDKDGVANVRPGDKIVSLLVPNDAAMSIKNLNDNVFGPETNNLLIEGRKKIVDEEFGKAGLEVLEQSFKEGYFKMRKGGDASAVAAAIDRVNARVTALFKKEAGNFRKKFDGQESSFAKGKRANIDLFVGALDQKGYRMTGGAVEVGEPEKAGGEDHGHIELAVAMAAKGAMMGREQAAALVEDPRKKLGEYLKGIAELRGNLEAAGTVRDAEGNVLRIFSRVSDGRDEYSQINVDLIRDIRKGKFKPSPEGGNQKIADMVGDYMKKINILDIIKPYTHKELSGDAKLGDGASLAERTATKANLAEKMRDPAAKLSAAERELAATLLKQEGKDPEFESTSQFHDRALKIDNCEYISLDALDVGPKLLQEYERLLQQVEKGEMTFDAAALIAGDATTENMRRFRRKAMETYKRVTGAAEAPPALVGGDEFTLAIDRGSLSEEKLKELLLGLREMTEARVVHTVVAAAERTSGKEDGDLKRRGDHLDALEVAERGAGLAKEIESKLRKLGSVENILDPGRKAVLGKAREALGLSNYAITEKTSGGSRSFVVVRAGAGDLSEHDLKQSLRDMDELVTEQVRLTIDDLKKDGFGADQDNVRQILSLIKTAGRDAARRMMAGSGNF